ncbi:MAG: lipase family protein, partial [Calditrichota bacterium]
MERLIFLLLMIAYLSGCLSNPAMDSQAPVIITNPPSTDRGYLLSYSQVSSMPVNEIVQMNRDIGDISGYAQKNLDLYSIVYNSVDSGTLVQVSGLVFIPQNTDSLIDIIQNHHGTIIPEYGDEETPSTYTGGKKRSSEMYFVGATMASNGYVVSMPDYVGYGESGHLEHPYTVHRELAEVSIDMLRATRQLLNLLSVRVSDNVFLTGWSEGGGAGLATHKALQENPSAEFNVVASSLFAGPYDYVGFLKDIFINRTTERDELSIYSWSVYALNKYNQTLNRAASTIWQYEVTDQLDALDVPSLKPSEIFQSEFIDTLINESDKAFTSAVMENTLISGWIPSGQLYFHSGTADKIVPHYNSVNRS